MLVGIGTRSGVTPPALGPDRVTNQSSAITRTAMPITATTDQPSRRIPLDQELAVALEEFAVDADFPTVAEITDHVPVHG